MRTLPTTTEVAGRPPQQGQTPVWIGTRPVGGEGGGEAGGVDLHRGGGVEVGRGLLDRDVVGEHVREQPAAGLGVGVAQGVEGGAGGDRAVRSRRRPRSAASSVVARSGASAREMRSIGGIRLSRARAIRASGSGTTGGSSAASARLGAAKGRRGSGDRAARRLVPARKSRRSARRAKTRAGSGRIAKGGWAIAPIFEGSGSRSAGMAPPGRTGHGLWLAAILRDRRGRVERVRAATCGDGARPSRR